MMDGRPRQYRQRMPHWHGTRASTYMRTSVGTFEENQQRHLSRACSGNIEAARSSTAAATGTHSPVAPPPVRLVRRRLPVCASLYPAYLLRAQPHFSAHSRASAHTAATQRASMRFSAHRRPSGWYSSTVWPAIGWLRTNRATVQAEVRWMSNGLFRPPVRSYPRTSSRVRRPTHSHNGTHTQPQRHTQRPRTIRMPCYRYNTQLPRNRKR
jgi:hypothetical protein